MKLSKLSKKLVVNTLTGEVLGYISDLELDVINYDVQHFVIEEKPSLVEKVLPWIFKKKTYQVTIGSIDSIGSDVILIRVKTK